MVEIALRRRVEVAYGVALLASLVLLAITGAAWGVILVSVVAVAHVLPARGAVLGASVSRFFIATIAVLSAYQVEAVGLWLAHVHVVPQVYALVTGALAAAAWIVARRRGWTSSFTFGRRDVVLLLPALVIVGVYLARVILPSEADSRSVIRATNMAMDDTSHMAMVNALLRNDANLLISPADADRAMALPQHLTYPMGWHLSSAVVVAGIDPLAKTAALADFIAIYFYVKVATLGLSVLAVTIFTAQVITHVSFSIRRFWVALGLLTGVGFTVALVVLPQFIEGFFSFLSILVYTPLFVGLVLDGFRRPRDVGTSAFDVVLLLCVTGSALSWLLTSPALLAAFAVVKLHQAKKLRAIPLWIWMGAAIASLVILFQVWVLWQHSGSLVYALAAPGGITAPDTLLLFVLLGLLVLLARVKRLASLVSPLFVALLPLLVTAALVFLYISLNSPTLSYYFLKFEFAILVIMVPVAIAALMHVLRRAMSELSQTLGSLLRYAAFVVVLVISLPGLFGYTFFYGITSKLINYTFTRDDAATLESVMDMQFGSSNERVFFYLPENPARNILASHLARTMYPNTPCDSNMFTASYSVDPAVINTTLEKCIGEYKAVIIYTDKADLAKLQAGISPALVQSHQVEIRVELS